MGPICPGGGHGVPANQRKYEEVKKTKRKESKYEQTFFLCGAIFSKIGVLNGYAFTVILSTNVIKMAYKS